MRGPVVTVAAPVCAAAVLLAGCGGADPPEPAPAVTTPAPSATIGGPPAGSGRATAAPPPVATGTAAPPPVATGTAAPPASGPAPGPLAAYQALLADWQRARSRFFTALSDGRPRTVAEQRALAAAYLAATRRFAAGLRSTGWTAAARPAARELLAANAAQQAHLVAMARAPSRSAFTGRLADYGVGAARENRAAGAVLRALGG